MMSAGTYSIASAGINGSFVLTYYDCDVNRYRHIVAYVGETLDRNGNVILPNVAYTIECNKLVRVN